MIQYPGERYWSNSVTMCSRVVVLIKFTVTFWRQRLSAACKRGNLLAIDVKTNAQDILPTQQQH